MVVRATSLRQTVPQRPDSTWCAIFGLIGLDRRRLSEARRTTISLVVAVVKGLAKVVEERLALLAAIVVAEPRPQAVGPLVGPEVRLTARTSIDRPLPTGQMSTVPLSSPSPMRVVGDVASFISPASQVRPS